MTFTTRFAAVALAALGAAGAARADIVSSFGSGLEGWTGSGGAVTYAASGGNAGGHLRQQDTEGGYMAVFAPAAFLGDLSSYLGGSLSFDGLNANGVPDDLAAGPWFGTVTITGSAGTAVRAVAGEGFGHLGTDGQWRSFSAALDPALWSGDLVAVLGNVTQLSVTLEFNDTAGAELAGFDNFRLATAVPEPTPVALLLAGLGVVGFLARSRGSRAR